MTMLGWIMVLQFLLVMALLLGIATDHARARRVRIALSEHEGQVERSLKRFEEELDRLKSERAIALYLDLERKVDRLEQRFQREGGRSADA